MWVSSINVYSTVFLIAATLFHHFKFSPLVRCSLCYTHCSIAAAMWSNRHDTLIPLYVIST